LEEVIRYDRFGTIPANAARRLGEHTGWSTFKCWKSIPARANRSRFGHKDSESLGDFRYLSLPVR